MPFSPLRLQVPESLRHAVEAALTASAFGPFVVSGADAGEADALFVDASACADKPAARAANPAVIVVLPPGAADPAMLGWLQQGAADVIGADDLLAGSFGQRLRVAIERHRLDRDAHQAYATDLGTGLPHRQQLVEHMSHLMALREREPAPMAVLVLRIEGFETTVARFGREAANVLRRKLAVRLRAGVRASDVVASLDETSFAVLLAALLAPADAERVGTKLVSALQLPFKISGQDIPVAVALGLARHPEDGAQPDALLSRAAGLAAAATAQGRGRPGTAANDD